jgi:hypothetical protein
MKRKLLQVVRTRTQNDFSKQTERDCAWIKVHVFSCWAKLFDKEGKLIEVFEGNACSTGYGAKGVFGNMHGKFRFVVDAFVKASEHTSATCQINARAENIR